MKTLFKINPILVITLLCLTFQLQAQEGEKQKIINLVNTELESFTKKDKAKWESCWAHTDKVHRVNASSGFFTEIIGWDSLSRVMKPYFDETGEGFKATKSIIDINIHSGIAIVHTTEKSEQSNVSIATLILEKQGSDWKFLEMYSSSKSSYENSDVNIEANLNAQGYYFLTKDKTDEAIKVFQLNTELFPNAWNTWDSLAEGYMKKGDKEKAIEYYEKSLMLNPKNDNAQKFLTELKK